MFNLNPNNYFAVFNKLVKDPADDSIDRLSSGISIYILMAFCVLTCSSLYVGSPMECMFPQNSPGSWENYYASYCFVQPQLFTKEGSDDPTAKIPYYPWIPYFLLLQAILFYLPKFLWDGLKSRCGLDLKTVLKEAQILSKLKEKFQKKKANEVAAYIVGYLRFTFEGCSLAWFSVLGVAYFAKKWFYVIMAAFQFYVMSAFIGSGDYYWGFTTFYDMITQDAHSSGVFPRLTTCYVGYTEDNMEGKRHSLSCVMGMNVIFEKIYVILYFWILFVLVISIMSACYATLIVLSPTFSLSVITGFLKGTGVACKEKDVLSFMRGILHIDGLLAIKLIHKAYGPAVSELMTRALWDQAQIYNKAVDPVLVNMNKYETFDPNAKEISLNCSSIPLLDNSLYKNKNVSYC